MPGQKVKTNSPLVQRAREGVFVLSLHSSRKGGKADFLGISTYHIYSHYPLDFGCDLLLRMEFLLANHPLDCPICDQGGQVSKYKARQGKYQNLRWCRLVPIV